MRARNSTLGPGGAAPTMAAPAMAVSVLAIPVLAIALIGAVTLQQAEPEAIRSRLITTAADELVLVQEVVVEAAVGEVWKAYATAEGWMAWSAPVAQVDLRAGGTIRTHYVAGAAIGDPGTNVLNIVNYVPERVLTLRAELNDRWPEVMRQDEGRLMNVIVFESLGDERTRILSYGVGYRDLPAYQDLMEFFIPANEGLFRKLKAYLED